MAARRSSRIFLASALIATVLAVPVFSCPHSGPNATNADAASPAEKNRNERERCKRSEGQTPSRGCTEGGERLPQDKRSPLDNIPPLTPLVA